MSLVSVIVPTYNAGAYLPLLCDSLLAQSHGDFEVLIGNDGSTDNTTETIQPYLKDPRFSCLEWEQNRGAQKTMVRLMREARGEFWCTPGADDVLAETFIQKRLEVMQAHPDAAMVHGPMQSIDEEGRILNVTPSPLRPPSVLRGREALEVLLQHNILGTSSVMLREAYVRPVLAYWGDWCRYALDWFLWILLAGTGREFIRDETVLVSYRVHLGSLTISPQNQATRMAETRLVPMLALSKSAAYSEQSAVLWKKWHRPLYCLWLRRAMRLPYDRARREQWHAIASEAYYGSAATGVRLWPEILRHGPSIAYYSIIEAFQRRRQCMLVAGLSLINHPLFSRDPKAGARQSPTHR